MRVPHSLLVTGLLYLAGCGQADSRSIVDVPTCIDRGQAKLYENRSLLSNVTNQGPEFYLLDGSREGDPNLALAYMKKNGWTAWASDKPEDQKKLFLVPNTSDLVGDVTIGKLEDGPRLACHASKLSGVPFVSVTRRAKDLSAVVYEFQL